LPSIDISVQEPSASRPIEEHPIERTTLRLHVVIVALHEAPLVRAPPPSAARPVRSEEPQRTLAHRARPAVLVDRHRAGSREEPSLESIRGDPGRRFEATELIETTELL